MQSQQDTTLLPRGSEGYGAYELDGRAMRWLRFAQRQNRTWAGRKLALFARRRVLQKEHEAIDADAEGFRLRIHPRDNVSERKFLFMPQFCDPVERQYLRDHLTADGVFLDLGANAGIYTLTAARQYETLGGSGSVLAVEANPVMQQRLDYNIALNQLGSRVEVVPVALSDHDGPVQFRLSQSNLGECGLADPGEESMTLPGRSLLSLLRERAIPRLDGMKIDLEGCEDVVLAPFFAEAPPELHPRFIIIEKSADCWRIDLMAILGQAGFREFRTERMNCILVRDVLAGF